MTYTVAVIRGELSDRYGVYREGVLVASFHSRAGARRYAQRREALSKAMKGRTA